MSCYIFNCDIHVIPFFQLNCRRVNSNAFHFIHETPPFFSRIVQSVLYVMESLLIFLLGWVPFFYEIKLIATVWMISPHSKLVKILYTNGIEALLVDNEERFDALAAKGTRQFFMVLHNMIGVIIRLLQTEVKSDASMGLKTL
eukprot:TRINITY_DN3730_c0_g1_i8.p1 TRINITY_DN3730_c0_g1~~TRINITY_DN3730_c0_g1_i8.p1  ORF type:complete len:143 (-),score=20.27 TRINITY_DN3730_c0_g1_i8:410-838(-)